MLGSTLFSMRRSSRRCISTGRSRTPSSCRRSRASTFPPPRRRKALVVDDFGVLNNLGTTLAAYRNVPPVVALLRDLAEEAQNLEHAAEEVAGFFTEAGIDEEDLARGAASRRAVLLCTNRLCGPNSTGGSESSWTR